MIQGLVSTIIPVYNRPVLLREAVESVLAQAYRPIEIIVVDDGSTDDTATVGAALQQSFPETIDFVRKPNEGPGLARETGRLRARGEFLQYLDSDDLLLPAKFERQVAGLRAHPGCGVSYGATRHRHAGGRVESQPGKGSGARVETMFPSFLRSRWWDTPTPLYRASLCEAAGPWSDLRLEEDWEYDCRIAALGVRLHRVDDFVAEVRDHDEERLCRGSALDPERLRNRARAHTLIFAHAVRAGITPAAPEMQHFARELFLLSRQCGAAGREADARGLYELSRKAAGPLRGNGPDFRAYGWFARAVGWSAAGRLACWSDRFRS